MQHLSVWSDYIEVPQAPAQVADAEITAMEDEAQALRFREVKAKMANDVAAMTAFNAKVKENRNRVHVVGVMHEKAQIAIGRQFFGENFKTIVKIDMENHEKSKSIHIHT